MVLSQPFGFCKISRQQIYRHLFHSKTNMSDSNRDNCSSKREDSKMSSQRQVPETQIRIVNCNQEKEQLENLPLNNDEIREEPSLISISEEPKRFYPYSLGEKFSVFSRLFFFHLTYYTFFIKTHVLDIGLKIEEKHLPILSASENLESTISGSEKMLKEIQTVTCYTLVKLVFFGELKWITLGCFILFSIESAAKSGVSLAMRELITYVSSGNLNEAYAFGALLVGLNMLCVFCQHHGYKLCMVFSSKARMTLINFVYIKLTELSAHSIKEANIGKILNLISGDINYLESLFINIFQSSVILLSMIFGCYILWNRFNNPIGLLALVIIFCAYPIQIAMQSFNSDTLKLAKQFQDQRLKLTNELIEGIRLIKMYAWEQAFYKMITVMRNKEFQCYIKINLRTSFDRMFSYFSQIWSSFLFFVILYYGGYRKELDVAEIVATIQLLTFYKFSCIVMVSYGIQSIIAIKVSFDRIASILNIKNSEMTKIDIEIKESEQHQKKNIPVIELKSFSTFWTSKVTEDMEPILKNITVSMNEGELWAVIGRVGSGKSTFLNAFLFEIPTYKGSFKINGVEASNGKLTVAYVEQEPFIFPNTIRKNVLFGRPYNKILYQKVLHASQLESDLSSMKFQDYTEIGERGTTLSGGQKARLSLARALYQQADLYLFDDPLSAVDACVAKNIFHFGIKEFIFQEQTQMNPNKQKPIVILVTHQIQYAIECDKIAILSNGELIATGNYNEIKDKLIMINQELAQQLDNTQISKKQTVSRSLTQKRTKIIKSQTQENNLIGKEADQQSLVNLSTYIRYFKHWNILAIILVLAFESGSEVMLNLYQRVVSLFNQYQLEDDVDQAFYILGMLTLGLFICNFFKYLINTLQVQKIAQEIHQKMLKSITQAPVSYFDVNPSGRIINRFSNDMSLCDNQTNFVILDIIETIGNFIFSLATLTILQPYFLILVAFIIIVNLYQFSYSKNVISQLKEIELMQRSPLFDFLKNTLGGVVQVRVYGQQEWFRKQFLDISNKCNLNSLTFYLATRCFGFNIDMIGFIVQTIGIFLFLALNSDDISILSQGILLLTTYTDGLSWGLRQMITFDTEMSSYNRMFQIIDIEPEAPQVKPEDTKYKEFPQNGEIKFENIHMSYRKNCDSVLKGLSFTINSGEKIGCVGRTGAGKSSILQVIFRICEIESKYQSHLEIAGVEIRELGLFKLRNSIGIIPQSPFLFSGTIRGNLDPFDEYDDQALWHALEDTDLLQHVKALSKGLLTDMSDVHSVFSVGQKQLICLARVILCKKKIIVLDEATANVDMKTDDFVQETLKKKFKDCTLITIAHRLNTIADYDRVMVVSDGKIIEFDSPYNLIAQTSDSIIIDRCTEFAKLVKDTGDQNAQAIFDVAKNKHILNAQ